MLFVTWVYSTEGYDFFQLKRDLLGIYIFLIEGEVTYELFYTTAEG
jgi:hypothetical protein